MLAIVLEVAVRRSDMKPSSINSEKKKKNTISKHRNNLGNQKHTKKRIIKFHSRNFCFMKKTFFHLLQCSKQRFPLCLPQPLWQKQKLESEKVQDHEQRSIQMDATHSAKTINGALNDQRNKNEDSQHYSNRPSRRQCQRSLI